LQDNRVYINQTLTRRYKIDLRNYYFYYDNIIHRKSNEQRIVSQ